MEAKTQVSYCESPVFAIAKVLRSKGYAVASCTGLRCQRDPNKEAIGILKPLPAIESRVLWIRRRRERRALFIGVLWFDGRGTDHTGRTLDVYGRNNITELKVLAKEIAKIGGGMNIQLRLGSEVARLEHYLSDNSE